MTASVTDGDPLKASRVFPSTSASAADCAWTKECKRQPLAKEYKNQGDETPLAINMVPCCFVMRRSLNVWVYASASTVGPGSPKKAAMSETGLVPETETNKRSQTEKSDRFNAKLAPRVVFHDPACNGSNAVSWKRCPRTRQSVCCHAPRVRARISAQTSSSSSATSASTAEGFGPMAASLRLR